MENMFTPGPWRYCGQDRGQCKCGQVWSVPADFEICETNLTNEENGAEITREQQLANARLIASAPEMFVAVTELLSIYKKYANDDPQEDHTADYAQSLLNRITGVQECDATGGASSNADGQTLNQISQ